MTVLGAVPGWLQQSTRLIADVCIKKALVTAEGAEHAEKGTGGIDRGFVSFSAVSALSAVSPLVLERSIGRHGA